MDKWDLRMWLLLVFFLTSCGEGEKESSEETGKSQGEVEIPPVELAAEDPQLDYRDFLVAVSTVNKKGERQNHVGLGFRLEENSDEAFVAFLGREDERRTEVFSEHERSHWSPRAGIWECEENPNLKVVSMGPRPDTRFPLLGEYAQFPFEGDGSKAFYFKLGKSLYPDPEDDNAVQQVMVDEAKKLREQIDKYRREMATLDRRGSSGRIANALQNEIRKAEKELGDLGLRARRLGFSIGGSGDNRLLEHVANFEEKPISRNPEDRIVGAGTCGVVLNGELGLVREGILVDHLQGTQWVELVRPELLGGGVCFTNRNGDWFPRISLDWKGFVSNRGIERFEVLPVLNGEPDRSAPEKIEAGKSLLVLPFSRFANTKTKKFRCNLTLSPGDGSTHVKSFDFRFGLQNDMIVPLELASDNLNVRGYRSARRDDKLQEASFLKRLNAGGKINQAIPYESGRRLLIRVEAPSRIRKIDLEEMQWMEDWDLPGAETVTASNGRDLFLYQAKDGVLARRSLDGFGLENEIALENSPEVLAMGVGTGFTGCPLLLVYRNHLELRNPVTLEVMVESFYSHYYSGKASDAPLTVEFLESADPLVVVADPYGEAFSIHSPNGILNQENSKSLLIYKMGGIWRLVKDSNPVLVTKNKASVHSSRFSWLGSGISAPVPKRSHSSNVTYQAEGRGHVACTFDSNTSLYPAPPMLIEYLSPTGKDPLQLCYGGQAAVANLKHLGSRSIRPIGLFRPFFFIPELGRIVSLEKDTLTFESVPEGMLPAEEVYQETPVAQRGETYRYLPKTTQGKVPGYTLTKGPEGLAFSKESGFLWKVPPGYHEHVARVEVTDRETGISTAFVIPVTGKRLSAFTNLLAPNEVTAIEPVFTQTFDTPISAVEPAANGDFLLVSSNQSRTVSVVDLESGETRSKLDSPGGPMEVCPIHEGVLILYLDGMILEKRSLPTLKRQKTRASTAKGKLISLVVGRSPNSGKPFGIFDTGDSTFSVCEFDLESLVFDPAIPIPDFWTNQYEHQDKSDWLRRLPRSADGRKVWANGNLLKQESPGRYQYSRNLVSGANSENTTTDASGNFLFTERGRYQPGARNPLVMEGKTTNLIPDHRGDWMINIAIYDSTRGKPSRQVVDFITTKDTTSRYRLEGLEEFTFVNSYEFRRQIHNPPTAHLCGTAPYLVTRPRTRNELVIRKLPNLKN